MANALIAFQNRIDEAALSAGSWSAGLPLNNLKTRVLSQVARSTDAANASTKFRMVFAKPRKVQILALCRHNFSLDATYRIRAYSDAGFTALAYDSGVLPVWSAVYVTEDLEWEDDNYWSGTITDEERQGFFWNLLHLLEDMVYVQYWQVEIFDDANAAGWVSIGRVFVAQGWTPVTNMSWGASLGYDSRSKVSEAYDGTEYYEEKTAARIAKFSLGFMNLDEAMTKALDIQRLSDITKEVFYVYDQADTLHLLRRSFLGRLRELTPVEQPYGSKFGTAFEIKELL